jgi:hypothetical protein
MNKQIWSLDNELAHGAYQCLVLLICRNFMTFTYRTATTIYSASLLENYTKN